MTLNESSSFVVSSALSLLLFSGMQVYKVALASTQLLTIVTGFLGAILYVLLLTAVANLEKTVFGFNFQSKLGEVNRISNPKSYHSNKQCNAMQCQAIVRKLLKF